jgi:KUP system potassium uptake protein
LIEARARAIDSGRVREGSTGRAPPRGKYLAGLSLAALGVVYGDIGTSPLYALRECFSPDHGIGVDRVAVLGVLSLIFWSLVIVVSLKYVAYVMRADNDGEGGILALTALAQEHDDRSRVGAAVVMVGLFGAALLYGDGAITPSISVLSAVEGLEIAAPPLSDYVLPIAVAILVGVFAVQHRGTGAVGRLYGPITLLWFVVIGTLGALQIVERPEVLEAVWPGHAVTFFGEHGGVALVVLGAVFLVVTGGEALYADMGHFGKRPIRLGWFTVVMPALLLNYFGQGALLLADPSAAGNPFYGLAPEWALYPLIALATAAAIIASQAVISGAFSLTLQAVMLGWLPRLEVRHTSRREYGQIYVPAVNWSLMVATVLLVVGFGSSSRMAAAYGVAVTTTMVITALLAGVVAVRRWRWPAWAALLVTVSFLTVDLSFFTANAVKIPDGGWVPLLIAGVIVTLMTTWKRGRAVLAERIREKTMSWEELIAVTEQFQPALVPGVAVYMSAERSGPPAALVLNVKHNRVIHEQVVVLTLVTERRPSVPVGERLELQRIDDRIVRLIGRYGFTERPQVPALLELAAQEGLEIDAARVTFFLGRETMFASDRPGMAIWRERLFAVMSRNARSATSFFGVPTDRVVEIGAQIEL